METKKPPRRIDPAVAKLRSTLANAHHTGANAALLKRALEIENLRVHIDRVAEGQPPLTLEQRDRLAARLRPSLSAVAGGDGDAA